MLDTDSWSTCDQPVGTTAGTDVVGNVSLVDVVLGGVVVVGIVDVVVGLVMVLVVAGVELEVLLGGVPAGCAGVWDVGAGSDPQAATSVNNAAITDDLERPRIATPRYFDYRSEQATGTRAICPTAISGPQRAPPPSQRGAAVTDE